MGVPSVWLIVPQDEPAWPLQRPVWWWTGPCPVVKAGDERGGSLGPVRPMRPVVAVFCNTQLGNFLPKVLKSSPQHK